MGTLYSDLASYKHALILLRYRSLLKRGLKIFLKTHKKLTYIWSLKVFNPYPLLIL